jgi:hypothetical protein
MGVQADIWRDLANKVALAAAELHDPQLRLSMLYIAAGYEALAKHAEALEYAADLAGRPDFLN